jgi:hypothetical protein
VTPLPLTLTIRELEFSDCNEMLLKELPIGMEKLVIEGFNALESLPKGMIDSNSSLQELKIYKYSSLMSLPKDGPPSSIKILYISECKKLELSTHLDHSSLEKLCLWNCGSLKCFPLDLSPKLYNIKIKWCSNLESLTVPKNYEHDLVTLQIDLSYCPNFVSFPKGGLRAPSLILFFFFDR